MNMVEIETESVSEPEQLITPDDVRGEADTVDTDIAAVVEAGCMVRTRTDSPTADARANDTADCNTAFASGARFRSTYYYEPGTSRARTWWPSRTALSRGASRLGPDDHLVEWPGARSFGVRPVA